MVSYYFIDILWLCRLFGLRCYITGGAAFKFYGKVWIGIVGSSPVLNENTREVLSEVSMFERLLGVKSMETTKTKQIQRDWNLMRK